MAQHWGPNHLSRYSMAPWFKQRDAGTWGRKEIPNFGRPIPVQEQLRSKVESGPGVELLMSVPEQGGSRKFKSYDIQQSMHFGEVG